MLMAEFKDGERFCEFKGSKIVYHKANGALFESFLLPRTEKEITEEVDSSLLIGEDGLENVQTWQRV
jgi:hypothetical protein